MNSGDIDVSPESTSDPGVNALAARLRDEASPLQAALEALFARAGVTPERGGIADGLARREETYRAEDHSGGVGLRSYVAYEALTHFQNLGILDRVLLPSAQDPEWRAFIRRARDSVAAHLALALETQTSLSGPRGGAAPVDAGGPGARATDVGCATPSFPLCSEAQVGSVLAAIEFDPPASWGVRYAVDPAVSAFVRRRDASALRLGQAVDAALAGAGLAVEPNDLARGMAFTAGHEHANLLTYDTGSPALDRELMAFEVVAHFEALEVLDRLLLASVREPALAAVAREARATAAEELAQAMEVLTSLEPSCGRPPVSVDAGPPASDAGCSDASVDATPGPGATDEEPATRSAPWVAPREGSR